jgi:hypothetical protein
MPLSTRVLRNGLNCVETDGIKLNLKRYFLISLKSIWQWKLLLESLRVIGQRDSETKGHDLINELFQMFYKRHLK